MVYILQILKIFAILSDNGSEFKKEFDSLLKEKGLTHYWTYPRSPKMNAHNERFNRTIQEQFVDYYEDLLFTDIDLFNEKMADWLIDYNNWILYAIIRSQKILTLKAFRYDLLKCLKWSYISE